MRYRNTNNYMRIAVQDAAGTTAPAIYVEVSPQDKDAYKKAVAEAKQRSGLSRYPNWSFR